MQYIWSLLSRNLAEMRIIATHERHERLWWIGWGECTQSWVTGWERKGLPGMNSTSTAGVREHSLHNIEGQCGEETNAQTALTNLCSAQSKKTDTKPTAIKVKCSHWTQGEVTGWWVLRRQTVVGMVGNCVKHSSLAALKSSHSAADEQDQSQGNSAGHTLQSS